MSSIVASTTLKGAPALLAGWTDTVIHAALRIASAINTYSIVVFIALFLFVGLSAE